jgi:SAM-dependent methyltransferase
MSANLKLTATPESEDFAHKYTEEGQGALGARLLDSYFESVSDLFGDSEIASGRKRVKAIEVGCGEGFSTQRLRELLPSNVSLQASEFVADLVPRARQRNPGVKVTQESIYETKHKDESFDLIFLLEVLEHLDYPDKALAELARILKPNGFLILGVPREPLWRVLNMARGKYLKDFGNTPGHLNHWSSRGLQKFIETNFGPIIEKRQPLPWTQVLAHKNHLT